MLCTIDDPSAAVARALRILKPGGVLVVLEHVRSPGALGRWQDRLTPLWRRVAGGCHLNRDTAALLMARGFRDRDFTRKRIVRFGLIQDIIYGVAQGPRNGQ